MDADDALYVSKEKYFNQSGAIKFGDSVVVGRAIRGIDRVLFT